MQSQEIDEILKNVPNGRVRNLLRNVLSLPYELIRSIIQQSDILMKQVSRLRIRDIRNNRRVYLNTKHLQDWTYQMYLDRNATPPLLKYGPGYLILINYRS